MIILFVCATNTKTKQKKNDWTNERVVHIIPKERNPTQSHTNNNQKYHSTNLHPIYTKVHPIGNTLQCASFPYPNMNECHPIATLLHPLQIKGHPIQPKWQPIQNRRHSKVIVGAPQCMLIGLQPKQIGRHPTELEGTPYQPIKNSSRKHGS